MSSGNYPSENELNNYNFEHVIYNDPDDDVINQVNQIINNLKLNH